MPTTIRQQIINAIDAKLKLITYAISPLGLGLDPLGIGHLGGEVKSVRQQIIDAIDIRLKAIP